MKLTSRYMLTLVTAFAAFTLGVTFSPGVRAQAASPEQAQGDLKAQQPLGSATSTTASQATESSSADRRQVDGYGGGGSTAAAGFPRLRHRRSGRGIDTGTGRCRSNTSRCSHASAYPFHDGSAIHGRARAHPLPNGGPFRDVGDWGVLSGIGMVQNNWIPGDQSSHWDVSNAQVFLQKPTGWWQFYFQGGAYNIPDLGLPYLSTNKSLSNWFGALPVGFAKFVKGGFSVEVGALPTLIGAEYTFDFENLNIERGLLWNQENAVNKGIQLNEAYKKLTLSFSWNDGFYSNRYTWLTGSLAYAINSANTVSFVAGGNAGATKYSTFASPIINNSQIYEIIYTYAHGNWFIQPYWQYTNLPKNISVGVPRATSTDGVALLFNYNFKHGVSVALRPEYISSNGSLANGAVNLLYGPGSNAFAFTFTPTWQKGGFFLRADLGVVDARSITPGFAFGKLGTQDTQTRGVIEAGFIF